MDESNWRDLELCKDILKHIVGNGLGYVVTYIGNGGTLSERGIFNIMCNNVDYIIRIYGGHILYQSVPTSLIDTKRYIGSGSGCDLSELEEKFFEYVWHLIGSYNVLYMSNRVKNEVSISLYDNIEFTHCLYRSTRLDDDMEYWIKHPDEASYLYNIGESKRDIDDF